MQEQGSPPCPITISHEDIPVKDKVDGLGTPKRPTEKLTPQRSHRYTASAFAEDPEARRKKELEDEKELLRANHETRSTSMVLKQWRSSGTSPGPTGWKLFRAALHVEDAWKRRRRVCPTLESPRQMKLYAWRSKLWTFKRLVVYTLLVLMLFEQPHWAVRNPKWEWSCYPHMPTHVGLQTGLIIETVLLPVLVLDAVIEMALLGEMYLKGEGALMVRSWLEHAALFAYIVDIIVAWAGNFEQWRVAGYCRVLIYLVMHRRTWGVAKLVVGLAWAVLDIWVLIFIFILIFSWGGQILFHGTAEGEFMYSTPVESWWDMLILLTTTNHPYMAVPAYDKNRWSYLYFLTFNTIGILMLGPMSLAVIYNIFRASHVTMPAEEDRIRSACMNEAFKLLDERGQGWIPMANVRALIGEINRFRRITFSEMRQLLAHFAAVDMDEHPKVTPKDFQDIMGVLDQHWGKHWMSLAEWKFPAVYNAPWFVRLRKFMSEPSITVVATAHHTVTVTAYDVLDLCLIVATLCLVVIAGCACDDENGKMCGWDIAQFVILLAFILLSCMKVAVLGWYNCWSDLKFRYDLFVAVCSAAIVLLCLSKSVRAVSSAIRVMQALRILYIVTILKWFPRMGFILDIFTRMAGRASTLCSVLIVWLWFMAYLGTQTMGGLICNPQKQTETQQCPPERVFNNVYSGNNYYNFNFNDMGSAIVTMFVLVVQNDWWVLAVGHTAAAGNLWPRVFFLFNWAFGIGIICNIITALVIDAFWQNYKEAYNRTPWGQKKPLEDVVVSDAALLTPEGDDASIQSPVGRAIAQSFSRSRGPSTWTEAGGAADPPTAKPSHGRAPSLGAQLGQQMVALAQAQAQAATPGASLQRMPSRGRFPVSTGQTQGAGNAGSSTIQMVNPMVLRRHSSLIAQGFGS